MLLLCLKANDSGHLSTSPGGIYMDRDSSFYFDLQIIKVRIPVLLLEPAYNSVIHNSQEIESVRCLQVDE